jgi:hypothetical protein
MHEAQLLARLGFLRTRRDLAAGQIARVDLEIGSTIGQLLAGGGTQSLSSIGRALGVSHTHVKALAQRAEVASQTTLAGLSPEAQVWRPPLLDSYAAPKYLDETGRHVVRVVAGFAETDVLWMTGLAPALFDYGWGVLDLPQMMWQLDDGGWVGVDMVNVGYGGTGCRLAFNALSRAGIDEALARDIVDLRWSDTDVAGSNVDGGSVWPRVPLAGPVPFGTFYVLPISEDGLGDRPAQEVDHRYPSGFYPSYPAGSPFTWAIDYLDGVAHRHGDALPEWARGTRSARVFLDAHVASKQGFGYRDQGCTLVIQQGTLQLWIFTYPPRDPTQLLSDQAYDALAYAGLYPDQLAKLDARSRFSRYLDHHFGRERPPYLDMSPDESAQLHMPGAGYALPDKPARGF